MTWVTLHSSDAGAPALSGTDGALTTLLDYVLVTMGAGWTIAHTDSNARVYQNALGNLYYVNHNAAVSGSSSRVVIRGCESATSASGAGLVDPYPTVAQTPDTQANWTLTDGNLVGNPREYRIIANEHWIILMSKIYSISSGTANGWNLQFFGDFPRAYSDIYASCVFVTGQTATSSTYGTNQPAASFPTIGNNIFFKRDISGSIKSVKGILNTPNGLGTFSSAPALRGGFGNRVFKKKIGIICSGGSGTAVGNMAIVDRVFLPQIWSPIHSGGYATSGVTDVDTFRDDTYNPSAQFKILAGSSTNYFIVELTNTWTPNG